MAYRFGAGTTFGEIGVSGATAAAFVGAVLGSAALWWTYFVRSAHDASEAIVHAADPGRMARSAYTYFRLPMIAGSSPWLRPTSWSWPTPANPERSPPSRCYSEARRCSWPACSSHARYSTELVSQNPFSDGFSTRLGE
jgi:hypothetical protein